MGRTSSTVKDRYNAKAYDEIQVRVSKGKKDTIQAHAAAQGESVNSFINRAIDQTMAQEAVGGTARSVNVGEVSLHAEAEKRVPAASDGRTEEGGITHHE